MQIDIGAGEHPKVVLADVCRRPKIDGRVLVFANEKGGVGKSTLAFHAAVSLARGGEKVLAIDLDRRQRSLAHALENRAATARSLGIELPSPISLVLEHPSGSMLAQEILRVGADCTTIIIDAPGHDTPIVRRAIALADKLITPVNANFIDLDGIARFSPATTRFKSMGKFAELVSGLRHERVERGLEDLEWVLVKNRVRSCERLQLERFDTAIEQLPAKLGLRIATGLAERVAFRDLYMFGLTHSDCTSLPGMKGVRVAQTPDLDALLEEIELTCQPGRERAEKIPCTRRPAKSLHRYRKSLRHHMGAKKRLPSHA